MSQRSLSFISFPLQNCRIQQLPSFWLSQRILIACLLKVRSSCSLESRGSDAWQWIVHSGCHQRLCSFSSVSYGATGWLPQSKLTSFMPKSLVNARLIIAEWEFSFPLTMQASLGIMSPLTTVSKCLSSCSSLSVAEELSQLVFSILYNAYVT